MSLISNIEAYTYTDKISALTLAPSPYNLGNNNYYNILYIGTSNGNIYLFNEQEQTIQSIVPTGYFGTLSGEITGMTVDPNGKFLFVNAPYDKHCLRISLTNIPISSLTQSITVPIDRDIYTFGDNTGNIVVSSTGVVYLVTGNGISISVIEQYGNSFINLFFLQTAPALNFKGIALSPNEQRIYANDRRLGDTYYYDFLSNQPTFNILSSYGLSTKLGDVVTSGNNIFYTRTDGVYSKNIYLKTTLRVAGNGKNVYVPTTDPQQFTLIDTNAVTSDQNGNIFLSSSNDLGQSQLYKVSFNLIQREGYQPPPARQELPILQPFPTTSCKRIVEPYNPRLRFGWGLTNTKKLPFLDVIRQPLCCPPPIVNCPVTPYYCLPPPPPVFPPQPVAPVYPTTSSTKQFMDRTLSIGSRPSIAVDATVLVSTSLTFSAVRSLVPPAFGPLGEIYFASENGNLTKIYNGGVAWTKSLAGTFVYASPVVSSTGAITVVTDLGDLYRLDSNASIFQFYPIKLGQQVGGSPACITNSIYDYIIAAYGNTIGAFAASNASTVWSKTTQLPGELFRTSVVSDGVNVFVGTNASRIYCYVAETGVLNWLYTIPSGGTPLTPSVTENNIGITTQYGSNIYILSNTTVRSQAYDISISLVGQSIISPPVLSTDPLGNLWAHVITSAGKIYGIGGIFNNVLSGNSYRYIWSNYVDTIIPSVYSNLLPVIDSAGFVYVPSTYGTLDQYEAYFTSGKTQVIRPNLNSLVMNGASTFNNPPIQISLTPLLNSKRTMYVFSRYDATLSNYMYTLTDNNTVEKTIIPVGPIWYTPELAPPSAGWSSIASSSNGTKLAAVGYLFGKIYTSSDSGSTWTQTSAPSLNWLSVASSSNGSNLAAVALQGGIYTSSNAGSTWTQTSAPSQSWFSIASSSDGTKLAAVGYLSGKIYTSSDSGSTWIRTTSPANNWRSIASSSNGIKLAATVYQGGIYISSDAGLNWTLTGAPTNNWRFITSSSDGMKLAAAVQGGGIYINANGGSGAWTQTSAPTADWRSIASSSDGLKLAAVVNGGGIYINSSAGVGDWTLQTYGVPTTAQWSSITSSSEGTKLAAVVNGGGVYLYS